MTQTTIHGRQLRDGTVTDAKLTNTPLHQDGSNAATGNIDLGTHKLVNVTDPTNPQDAATKNYTDGLINGLKWKAPVRAATTANGTLSSAFANGQTVDGVTLATGDRILLKNQTTGADNGIYVVAASGAPTRAADANASSQILQMTVMVEEGTANADTNWTCTNDGTITLGTTALTFVKIGPGQALPTFADEEVPSGTVNGSNVTFTLAHTPTSGSLKLYLNGQRIVQGGVDYTLSTATITYVTAPVTGDTHYADYRY